MKASDKSNHKSFPAASSGKTETPPTTTKKRAFRLRLKGIAPNTDKAQVAQFLSVSESCVRNVFHGEAIVMVDTEEAFQRCVEKDDEKLNGRFVKVTDETSGGAEQSRQELPHAREQRREQCRGEEENDDERTRRTGLDVREVRRGKISRGGGDVISARGSTGNSERRRR